MSTPTFFKIAMLLAFALLPKAEATGISLGKCDLLLASQNFAMPTGPADPENRPKGFTLADVRQMLVGEKLHITEVELMPGYTVLEFQLMEGVAPESGIEALVQLASKANFRIGFSEHQIRDQEVEASFSPLFNFLALPLDEIEMGSPSIVSWHEVGHAILHSDLFDNGIVSPFEIRVVSQASLDLWQDGMIDTPLLSFGELGADLYGLGAAADYLSTLEELSDVDDRADMEQILQQQVVKMASHLMVHLKIMDPVINAITQGYDTVEESAQSPFARYHGYYGAAGTLLDELHGNSEWVFLKKSGGFRFFFPVKKGTLNQEALARRYLHSADVLMNSLYDLADKLILTLQHYVADNSIANRNRMVVLLRDANSLFQQYRAEPKEEE